MTYAIWSTQTRNMVASYLTEEEALTFVRESLRVHGSDYVEELALVGEDRHGRSQTIAIGTELVTRASAVATDRVA